MCQVMTFLHSLTRKADKLPILGMALSRHRTAHHDGSFRVWRGCLLQALQRRTLRSKAAHILIAEQLLVTLESDLTVIKLWS